MNRKPFAQYVSLGILITIVTLCFLRSPGSKDVYDWFLPWVRNAETKGLASGYEANRGFYPPFHAIILLCVAKTGQFLRITHFLAFKLSVVLFLFLTSLAFLAWTRSWHLTIALHLSLLLCSVGLGYTDIYFAPTLILSLWALKKGRRTTFMILYCVSCLIKWQPLIIAPFVLVHFLEIKDIRRWRKIKVWALARTAALPAVMIAAFALLVFGREVLVSFVRGLTDPHLSGNALNLHWILTYVLHLFYPEKFGGLINGVSRCIAMQRGLWITILTKLLFVIPYGALLVSYFRRDKTFEGLLWYSLVGYWAYFILNTGVHENHLFLPCVFSVICAWLNRSHVQVMIALLIMSNINLFVFYGADGRGLSFGRVVGVDVTLLLALFNVIFFGVVFIQAMRRAEATPPT